MVRLQRTSLDCWNMLNFPNKISLFFSMQKWVPACAGMTSKERRDTISQLVIPGFMSGISNASTTVNKYDTPRSNHVVHSSYRA